MSALEDLQAAVAANTDAVNAAIAAGIGGGTGVSDAALEPLTAQVTANTDALNAATAGGAIPVTSTETSSPDVGASANPPA